MTTMTTASTSHLRCFSALNRNLQSVLRWSSIPVAERNNAEGTLAHTLSLRDDDLEPLRFIGVVVPDDSVMPNLLMAWSRVHAPHLVKTARCSCPLVKHAAWPHLRVRAIKALSANIREGIAFWGYALANTTPETAPITAQGLIQQRVLQSAYDLGQFAAILDRASGA
jgi:hypothetical protein